MDGRAWWAAVHGVAKSRTRLSDFTFTFHFPALEKEMATHSSVLAWRIPGTAEPGGLPSMGLHSRTRLKRLSSSSSSPKLMFLSQNVAGHFNPCLSPSLHLSSEDSSTHSPCFTPILHPRPPCGSLTGIHPSPGGSRWNVQCLCRHLSNEKGGFYSPVRCRICVCVCVKVAQSCLILQSREL